MTKSIPTLSKMWLKVRNIENTLFPYLEETLGELTTKESKLIRILDFAEIERFVTCALITNRSISAKSKMRINLDSLVVSSPKVSSR